MATREERIASAEKRAKEQAGIHGRVAPQQGTVQQRAGNRQRSARTATTLEQAASAGPGKAQPTNVPGITRVDRSAVPLFTNRPEEALSFSQARGIPNLRGGSLPQGTADILMPAAVRAQLAEIQQRGAAGGNSGGSRGRAIFIGDSSRQAASDRSERIAVNQALSEMRRGASQGNFARVAAGRRALELIEARQRNQSDERQAAIGADAEVRSRLGTAQLAGQADIQSALAKAQADIAKEQSPRNVARAELDRIRALQGRTDIEQSLDAPRLEALLTLANNQQLMSQLPKESRDMIAAELSSFLRPETNELAGGGLVSGLPMREFADGGLVSGALTPGFANGGPVSIDPMANPMGGAAPMQSLDPIIREYGQYVATATQNKLRPVPLGKFIDLLKKGREILQGAPAANAGTVGLAAGGQVPAIPVAGAQVLDETGSMDFTGGDTIPAVIDGRQPAALTSGEMVIPAEVVAIKGTEFFQNIIDKYMGGKEGPA